MNISRQIGWSQESNLLYQILKQLNKLTSIMFGLKPKYKVYTALVTQSGTSNSQTLSSGAVTKGVTYYITDASDGDFSNVGAPSNDDSTYFVATNDEVPNSYGSALLRYDTGAPVVTVLENTIGNIYWTYSQEGNYQGNLNSTFFLNKTYYSVNNRFSDDGGASAYDAFLFRGTDDYFVLNTFSGGIYSNSLINPNNPLSIEIRVYN